MLVLSRKCGEELVIPQFGVRITVIEVRGHRVRLGIAAPSDVAVHRAEVWQKVRGFQQPVSENAAASEAVPSPL